MTLRKKYNKTFRLMFSLEMAIQLAIKEINYNTERRFQNGCKNEWIITGKNESRSMFKLTWFSLESFMTEILYYVDRYYIDRLIERIVIS